MRGDILEGFAVEDVERVDDFRADAIGEGDEDGADGFLRRATGGPGDASDREGVVSACFGASTLHHGTGRCFTDGTVGSEGFGGDAEELLLGFVAVGDEASEEDSRSAGDIREAVGDEAAGAGFREGESFVPFGEHPHDSALQVLIVLGEDVVADPLINDVSGFVDGLFRAAAFEDEAHIDFTDAGAVADLQTGLREMLEGGGDLLFHAGFTKTDAVQGAADEGGVAGEFAVEERDDFFEEHGPQFTRWPGEHDNPGGFAVGAIGIRVELHRQAGRGAVAVLQHESAFGYACLHKCADGHGAIALLEETFDVRGDARVFVQGFAKQFGDEIARDVIRRGAEAAGADDEVGVIGGLTDGVLDGAAFIGDGHLALDEVAAIGELAAEPLLVGIEDAAEHQLGAGVDDFDVHSCACRGRWAKYRRYLGLRQFSGKTRMTDTR